MDPNNVEDNHSEAIEYWRSLLGCEVFFDYPPPPHTHIVTVQEEDNQDNLVVCNIIECGGMGLSSSHCTIVRWGALLQSRMWWAGAWFDRCHGSQHRR